MPAIQPGMAIQSNLILLYRPPLREPEPIRGRGMVSEKEMLRKDKIATLEMGGASRENEQTGEMP
jgi:hypothetical protein